MRRDQRGIALITVMLVTSLALLITAGMLRSHRLALHSSVQQLHQIQLRQLGFAGEAWARQRLNDLQGDPKSAVAAGQAWATGTPAMNIENGQVQVRIEDLAGRFNVTALLGKGPVDKVMAQRWLRLQTLLDLAPVHASAFEDLSLSDISQLRQVQGVDARWFARMQPWIVLLDKGAALNINTAPATLLATLEGVTPQLAQRLIAERPIHGYASVQDFTFIPALIGLGINSQGLGVNSRWFRITTDAHLGPRHLRLESDMARNAKTGEWHLLQRRFLAPTHGESS